jgi:hypothetical protein
MRSKLTACALLFVLIGCFEDRTDHRHTYRLKKLPELLEEKKEEPKPEDPKKEDPKPAIFSGIERQIYTSELSKRDRDSVFYMVHMLANENLHKDIRELCLDQSDQVHLLNCLEKVFKELKDLRFMDRTLKTRSEKFSE